MVADDFPVKLNPVQEGFFFRLWKAHVFKSFKKKDENEDITK